MTRICLNFSTVYNDTLVAKGLIVTCFTIMLAISLLQKSTLFWYLLEFILCQFSVQNTKHTSLQYCFFFLGSLLSPGLCLMSTEIWFFLFLNSTTPYQMTWNVGHRALKVHYCCYYPLRIQYCCYCHFTTRGDLRLLLYTVCFSWSGEHSYELAMYLNLLQNLFPKAAEIFAIAERAMSRLESADPSFYEHLKTIAQINPTINPKVRSHFVMKSSQVMIRIIHE